MILPAWDCKAPQASGTFYLHKDISIALRQGTVEFVRHGVVANRTSAPRLRTRW